LFEIEYSINQIERQKKGLKKMFGFLGGGKKNQFLFKMIARVRMKRLLNMQVSMLASWILVTTR